MSVDVERVDEEQVGLVCHRPPQEKQPPPIWTLDGRRLNVGDEIEVLCPDGQWAPVTIQAVDSVDYIAVHLPYHGLNGTHLIWCGKWHVASHARWPAEDEPRVSTLLVIDKKTGEVERIPKLPAYDSINWHSSIQDAADQLGIRYADALTILNRGEDLHTPGFVRRLERKGGAQ